VRIYRLADGPEVGEGRVRAFKIGDAFLHEFEEVAQGCIRGRFVGEEGP